MKKCINTSKVTYRRFKCIAFFSYNTYWLLAFFAGVLENGIEDFQGDEEIYEAIGEVLLQLDDSKTECDIK